MFDNLENLPAQFPQHRPRPADAPTPLQGMRVLEFGHFVAAPYAAMMLADFGAEVIKVESPGGGDIFRHFAPLDERAPGRGGPFFTANRNKRSLAVDLKSAAGRDIVLELVAQSDVLIENYSTGVLDKLGLGYEACRALNPRIVYCSVSAYGRDGPFAHRAGYDTIVQAECGLIDMTGFADREGVRPPASVVDMATALYASNAILAALMARNHTGQGQYCEAALFDSGIGITGYLPMKQLFSGEDPQRTGNRNPDSAPSTVFRCKDRSFYLSTGSNPIFQRMCEALDLPELPGDPRFATPASRVANADAINAIVQQRLETEPWAYWAERLNAHGVPAGEVRTLGEALRSDEARHREVVTVIPDPEAGWIPNLSLPAKLAGTPAVDPLPAPRLGQDNLAILGEVLGYDADRIAALRAGGAFGA
ncbi:MAG TPA: CoA transferase [Novosphingobium sp.]